MTRQEILDRMARILVAPTVSMYPYMNDQNLLAAMHQYSGRLSRS